MAGQGMDYNVDIVMCIDGTGSMYPFIDQVKANALSFHDMFVNAMEEANKDVAQVRVKVIVFRDYGVDAKPMEESKFFVLPDENDAFSAFVNGIEADGGGDIPENALEAIALAMKSDWTTEGSKRRHAIVVFTDAEGLKLGERKDSASYPAGMPSDLAQLGAWWEGTDQSFGSNYQPVAGRLVAFAPEAYPWNELSTWNRYWPAVSKAGDGLGEFDMQNVLDILVGSFGAVQK